MSTLVLAVLLAQAKDPADVLDVLETQLRKAVQNSRPAAREKLRSEARDAFEREIGRSAARTPKAAWDYFSDFVGRIAYAQRAFSAPDEKPERDLWIHACVTTLIKQAGQSKESRLPPEQQPTTAELFDDCFEASIKVRTRFLEEKNWDLARAGYQGANHVVQSLLRKARAPRGEPKNLHATHLDLINGRLSLTREADRQANEYANNFLRGVAKACLDRGEAARKER